MRIYRVVFVSVVLAAAGFGLPAASAQSPGDRIDFIVPSETPVMDGTGTEKMIFTGRALGLIGAGACNSGVFPLQNVVFVHPNRSGGGATTATTIVINLDPIPAGTQLEQIQIVENCTGPDGSDYDKYVATIR